MKKLLVICTQESHYQFNCHFYDQVDEVSMGSPLGPLFTNVFMADFEEKHMESMRELGLKIWSRYVDDVFATMNKKEEATHIVEFLNKQHKNIRFTIEHEENKKLPFLDTRVIRSHHKYVTAIYHKPAFTGVYLNWTSLTARK